MKPLDGIRVLDVSRVVSGPLCAWLLGALGAEVVRVEAPGGDVTWLSPPFVGPDGVHDGRRGERDLALSPLRRGRGKRSIVLDLKHPEGKRVFTALLAKSDVLVENFVPGALANLGFDDAMLRERFPRLVHCSITGYGPDGPLAGRSSLDLIVQAVSGLMAKTGFADGEPTKVGATVGDQLPAIYAALGVVAALRQRDRDGQGQKVDIAMLDTLVSLLWDEPLDHYAARGVPERYGNSDPRGAPFGLFATRDGWVALVVTSQAQWEQMATLFGRPELGPRYPDLRARVAARDAVHAVVSDWCATQTTDAAVTALHAAGVPVGPLQSAYAATADPQVAHRGALVPLHHPDAEADAASGFHGPAFPVRLSRTDTDTTPAEPLGASTDDVLRDLLELDADAIAALRDAGVLG
ncbi:MAG: CoA transferase [Myxococcota bacterium]